MGGESRRGSEDKYGYGRNTYASSLLQFADVWFPLSHANKALLVASEKGQVDKVRQLITANADVEARDEVTSTSMHTYKQCTHALINNTCVMFMKTRRGEAKCSRECVLEAVQTRDIN